MELVNVPGTVSRRLSSSAPHMRSARMNKMIHQCHLRDGFLKAQGTSTFAIVNPECPIRRDKVKYHLHVRRIQYRTTSDSWRFFPDVICRLKCNVSKFVILIMKSLSFMFTLAICPILNGYTQVVF